MVERALRSGKWVAGVAMLVSAATVGATGIDPATVIIPDSGDSALVYAAVFVALVAGIPGIIAYCGNQHGAGESARSASITIASMALATLIFFAVGYSLAFDLFGTTWIGGGTNFMLNAMGTVRDDTTIAETAFVAINWVGLLMAVAALTAGLAHRARTGWLLGFSGLWSLLVLTPVLRATWGGGWLAQQGVIDAAGGLSLFFVALCSLLVALRLIGQPADAPPASHAGWRLAGAGALAIGVAAYAAGRTMTGVDDNAFRMDDSAVAMLTAATTAMTASLAMAALRRAIDATAMADGLVAGILAFAAAGSTISIGSAWLLGIVAALAAHFGPRLTPAFLRWPDPGGQVVAMAGAAKVGVILSALFLSFDWFTGSGYGEGMTMGSQILVQLIALAAVALWAVVGTVIAALMVGLVLPMRRDDQ